MLEVRQVAACQNRLGEGPLWHTQEKALYWVDIEGKKIQRYFPADDGFEVFDAPLRVTLLAFRENGGVICGTEDGFHFWDRESNTFTFITDPEAGKEGARFNDGKVDRAGRLWAGTMRPSDATSALYLMEKDLSVRKILDKITISNGIGWSPDNETMYYVDSLRYVIFAFDYDLTSGKISRQRPFLQLNADYGTPDGLTVDSEGYVWCAIYGGWKVIRIDPSGKISLEIPMPVSQPSSCMFGGENLDTLFITSISDDIPDPAREPMAGDLFAVKPGATGLPEPKFAG